MTIQQINLGNLVNDGLGDDLRTAFQKVNANFADLNSQLTTTASNIGNTGYGVFNAKVGNNLEFKNLVPGNNITISEQTTSLVINSSPGGEAFNRFIPDTGSSITADPNTNNGQINITGGANLRVSGSGSTLTIDSKLNLGQILENFDFGPITEQFVNPTQLALAASNIDMGTIESPGRLSLDLGSII
jgi:hypothetical protein